MFDNIKKIIIEGTKGIHQGTHTIEYKVVDNEAAVTAEAAVPWRRTRILIPYSRNETETHRLINKLQNGTG